MKRESEIPGRNGRKGGAALALLIALLSAVATPDAFAAQLDYAYALVGQPSSIFELRFSPDGSRLVSVGATAGARTRSPVLLWSVPSDLSLGALLARSSLYEGRSCVAWSPDGLRIATGAWQDEARLLSVSDGLAPVRFYGSDDHSTHVEFIEEGRRVVTFGLLGHIRVFDAASASLVRAIDIGSEGEHLAVHPRLPIATVTQRYAGWLKSFNLETGAPVGSRVLNWVPTSVKYSPDGNLLVATDSEGGVHVMDARTWTELGRHSFGGYFTYEAYLAFSRDSRWLVAGHREALALIDLGQPSRVVQRLTLPYWARSADFSPSGDLLAIGVGGHSTTVDRTPAPILMYRLKQR